MTPTAQLDIIGAEIAAFKSIIRARFEPIAAQIERETGHAVDRAALMDHVEDGLSDAVFYAVRALESKADQEAAWEWAAERAEVAAEYRVL
jgi:hypothetical protein